MKRKESSFASATFEVPRPHLDVVEDVLLLFNDRQFRYKISDQTHEYSDIQELLKSRGRTITHLELDASALDGSYARMGLEFGDGKVRLSRHGNSPQLESLWFRIQDLFRSRAPLYYRLSNPLVWGLFFFGCLNISWIFAQQLVANPATGRIMYSVLTVTAGLWTVAWLIRRHAKVIVLERKHSAGFVRRNGDRIVLLLIGGIIGAAATAIINVLARS